MTRPRQHQMELTICGLKKLSSSYHTYADAQERQRLIGEVLRALRQHEFPDRSVEEGTVALVPRFPFRPLSSLIRKPSILETVSSQVVYDSEYPYTGSGVGPRLLNKSVPVTFTAVQNRTETERYTGDTVNKVLGGGTILTRSWSNTRNGTTVQRWRDKIEAGQSATGAMTAFRIKAESKPGHATVHWKTKITGKPDGISFDAIAGCIVPPVPTASTNAAIVTKADTGARRKMFKKISALKRDADVGETLAEYRQALTMLGKPLAGIQQLVKSADARGRALKLARERGRGTFSADSSAKALNKAAGQTWLEFWFGFYPLAKDIEALIKVLNETRSRVGVKKITASFKDSVVLSDTNVLLSQMSYFRLNTRTVTTLDVNVRYHMGINPNTIDTDSLLKRIGLSLDRFIPTAYAVIPYSWLFDYFTGLNQTIDALCEDVSFKTWTCKTQRTVKTETYVSIPNEAATRALLGNNLLSFTGGPWTYKTERVDVTRTIPVDLVPPPSLGIPTSWKPYANIVALLASRINVTKVIHRV